MNRKMEIILAVTIVLVLILFIGFNLFSSSFDSEKTLEELGTALDERDMKVLKEHLVYENGDKIPEDEIRDIFAAAEEKQIVLSDTELLQVYDEDEEKKDENERKYPIIIKEDGKKKLIYTDYKMEFSFYDLILQVEDENVDQIKVIIDDKEHKTEKIDNKFICFGVKPGIKDVKIQFGENFDQELEVEDVVLLEEGSRELDLNAYNLDRSKDLTKYKFNIPVSHYVGIDSRYISIYTDMDREDGLNVFLYIDGEKTDIKLDSQEAYEFGPVFEGQKKKLQAKMEIHGKEYVSQIVDLEDAYGSINLEIDYDYIDPEEKNSLAGEAIGYYMEALVDSINSGTTSYVDSYMLEGSPIAKAQAKLVENLYSKGTSETLLGYNINSIKEVSDREYKVNVTEEHRIHYESGKEEDVKNNWIYTVVIKDGRGLLTHIDRP